MYKHVANYSFHNGSYRSVLLEAACISMLLVMADFVKNQTKVQVWFSEACEIPDSEWLSHISTIRTQLSFCDQIECVLSIKRGYRSCIHLGLAALEWSEIHLLEWMIWRLHSMTKVSDVELLVRSRAEQLLNTIYC